MQAQLQIKNLTKQFSGIKAVNDVSLDVPKKSIISIIGPNGAGKTTLFNLITGFYKPDHGIVEIEGKQVQGLSPHKVTKNGIARTFQNIRLFPWMTVQDNIIVARQLRCSAGFINACFNTPLLRREEKSTLGKVEEIMTYFQLQNKWNYQAKNLAYGEQRKLEIARALATEPKILLLDEPTAGMNPTESKECVDLIFQINENLGITIIVIEHNMNVVMGVSDKIYVLDHGSKIAEGRPEEIQNNAEVIKAYLGEDYVANS